MRSLELVFFARSTRRRTLLQMHQNGLDDVRVGDICDYPVCGELVVMRGLVFEIVLGNVAAMCSC